MKHSRVFWFLVGNNNTGSSRIHGFNIHNALLKKGIKSKIFKQSLSSLSIKEMLWMSIYLRKGDLLILQKLKDFSQLYFLSFLKIKGVHIVFVDCDLPICSPNMAKRCDYIICTSKKLYQLYYKSYPEIKIRYIPDAVEYFIKKQKKYSKRAIYFGWLTASRQKKINDLKNIFYNNGWQIITMSNKKSADIFWKSWNKKKTYNIISEYCVSVIPIDDSKISKYKSVNRVVQSLALGNIVLCDDIESYKEVIKDGLNGFICKTPSDWETVLNKLSNEDFRNKIIREGYKTAEQYEINKIVYEWIEFLEIKANEE